MLVVFLIVFTAVWQCVSLRRFYLDKTCICQHDPVLTTASLKAFPFIISKCKSMICIVDEVYFTRLWCMLEVALFIKAHKGQSKKVKFVYSMQS